MYETVKRGEGNEENEREREREREREMASGVIPISLLLSVFFLFFQAIFHSIPQRLLSRVSSVSTQYIA
jgi:hypothetical protein